jgi:hydrogenase maturation protease
MKARRILLIGFGNPGRRDDGLGPALAEEVSRMGLEVTVDSDYQLSVEDAQTIAGHDVVVFADAADRGPEPFDFRAVHPERSVSFSTHSVRPEQALGLARELFDARTDGFVIAIRGYDFNEFGEALSDAARSNLRAAAGFLRETLPALAASRALDSGGGEDLCRQWTQPRRDA